MAFNLIDAVKSYLPADLIGKVAGYLGESPSNVSKGLDAVVPLSLAGIVQQAETGNATTLLSYAKDAYNSGILQNLGNTFSHEGGGIPASAPGLITSIFGDRFGSIANTISATLGLKGSTASALFGSILPLVMGIIGKHAVENNLTPGALATFLGTQKKDILSKIPAGLDPTKLLGITNAAPNIYTVHNAAPAVKKTNWVLPVIIALLAISLLWYFMRSCNKTSTDAVVTDSTTITHTDTVVATIPEPAATLEAIRLTLPNGVTIDAYKGGIEDKLIIFIKDSSTVAGNDNWFDFNSLNFTFGTANIISKSRKELDNIVQILKAYPHVKIKIGGYTDKVGDEKANVALSQARADAVHKALDDAGVARQITSGEGYGSQFAKYSADAPEYDRIKDRRISVSVREK